MNAVTEDNVTNEILMFYGLHPELQEHADVVLRYMADLKMRAVEAERKLAVIRQLQAERRRRANERARERRKAMRGPFAFPRSARFGGSESSIIDAEVVSSPRNREQEDP